jgi:hypothetical protein
MSTKKAVLVTFLWFSGFIIYALSNEVHLLELNGLGDYLAGVSAPMAFFWLYLAYTQQSNELRLQREQLTLQKDEIKQLANESRIQSFYKKMEFEEGSLDLLSNELCKNLINTQYSDNEQLKQRKLEQLKKSYNQGDHLAYWNVLQATLARNEDKKSIKELYYYADSSIGSMMAEQYIFRVNLLVEESLKLGVESVIKNRYSVKLCRSLEVRAPKI